MTAITVIPTRLAQAAHNPRNATTCGIYDIAGRIGQAHRSPAWIVRTINGYIAKAGFPRPFPIMVGEELIDAAHRDSRWPLVAVDAWFDDRLPPAARNQVERTERLRVDSLLSARADRLFGGGA